MFCVPVASSINPVLPLPPLKCNNSTVSESEPNALVGTEKLLV